MAYGFGTLGGGNLATDPDVQYGGFSFSPPPGMDRGTFAAVIGTIAGEIAAKGKVIDAAAIADVLANRLEDGSWGRSLKGIALDDEFSTNRKTERASNRISTAVRNAVMNGTAIPKGIAPRMEAVMNGFNAVFGTGQLKGITNNATFYQRDDIKNTKAGQWQRDNLQNKYGEKIIGEHAFSGVGVQAGGRFNANAPEINTDAFAKSTSTFDGRSLGPFGLGGWQDPAEVAASIRGQAPDVSMGTFYGGITAPPEWSLADLAPDVTQPPAPDWSRDFTDRSATDVNNPYGYSGIAAGSLPPSGDVSALRGDVDTTGAAALGYPGVTGFGPNAFGALNQTAPPDWGMEQGQFGDRGPPGPYSFSGMQTASMEPSMAVYDGGPWGYGQQPDYSGITEGITHGPSTANPFGAEPLGAPQGFGNYGAGEIGYPSGGFASQPSRPSGMSLADLGVGTVGMQGPMAFGYDPSLVSQATIGGYSVPGQWGGFGAGLPSTRDAVVPGRAPDMFADQNWAGWSMPSYKDAVAPPQTTRGIIGYEDQPVTTTTQVPNPAYSAWEEAFNNPKATTQQMYADDLADKLGQPTAFQGSVMNQAPMARGPAPSRTIGQTTTTTQRSPVYGDVPVGQPIGANLTGAGAGSWTSGLTNQANALNANIMDMGNWGLQGFTGSFNTGIGAPVGYGGGIGSLGALGGGPANVGSGWGLGGEAGGLGGMAGAAGFSGGDAGYGSDARSGRDGADQRND